MSIRISASALTIYIPLLITYQFHLPRTISRATPCTGRETVFAYHELNLPRSLKISSDIIRLRLEISNMDLLITYGSLNSSVKIYDVFIRHITEQYHVLHGVLEKSAFSNYRCPVPSAVTP